MLSSFFLIFLGVIERAAGEMMGLEKEDLGLSLGLGCAVDRRPLQLGLTPASTSSSLPSHLAPPRPSPWSRILASAAAGSLLFRFLGHGKVWCFYQNKNGVFRVLYLMGDGEVDDLRFFCIF